MKIATGKRQRTIPPRNLRAGKPPSLQDHDLPILALEQSTPRLDWEALIDDGVQPALLVAGERRWHGRR